MDAHSRDMAEGHVGIQVSEMERILVNYNENADVVKR